MRESLLKTAGKGLDTLAFKLFYIYYFVHACVWVHEPWCVCVKFKGQL